MFPRLISFADRGPVVFTWLGDHDAILYASRYRLKAIDHHWSPDSPTHVQSDHDYGERAQLDGFAKAVPCTRRPSRLSFGLL
jgi:hypothetical protein